MRITIGCAYLCNLLLLLLLLLLTIPTIGQYQAKVCYSEYKGKHTLLIEIDSSNLTKNYSVNCFSEPVTRLSDSIKLQLIEKLLDHELDTFTCIDPVMKLHPLSTQPKKPIAEIYTVQIEALLLINLLAFGSDVFTYSPYPVLMFIESRKEIQNNQKEISAVYAKYREWFNDVKSRHVKFFGYPDLESIGIKWFGSRPRASYEFAGGWSQYFNCPQIE